jgi:ABC-type phosphate transport system substrate-binding protein
MENTGMKITIGQLPSVQSSETGLVRRGTEKKGAIRHLRHGIMALAILALASNPALAGSVKVIANASVKADLISTDELKSVFLQETSSLRDGSHVEPVLAKSGAAHETFLNEYLGKSDSALQTYYRSLVFTGKGSMPKALGSDAEVAAYVAKTKGAIGYVSAGASSEGAKTLQVK